MKELSASAFILLTSTMPVIDVRSEKEFQLGHIPRAINLPLFNDEERAVVGTLYKNSGREASVLKGLEFAGPKLAGFVKHLHKLTDRKQVLVHCWRGGMRSNSMAWLFEQAGYEVFLLTGGYKAYRRFIHEYFEKPFRIILVGGKTGTGKTEILHTLEAKGEQILDLERLAQHRGSAFGGRADGFQPTNEQFYNNLFEDLNLLDPDKIIWIEDESRTIGKVSVPDSLFNRMAKAPLMKIECRKELRMERLVAEYAGLPKEFLEDCLTKIQEKMGGERMITAREALTAGNFSLVADITLEYYDKSYEHTILNKPPGLIHSIPVLSDQPAETADLLISFIKQHPIA